LYVIDTVKNVKKEEMLKRGVRRTAMFFQLAYVIDYHSNIYKSYSHDFRSDKERDRIYNLKR